MYFDHGVCQASETGNAQCCGAEKTQAKKQSHEPAEIWCPKSVLERKCRSQRWRNSEFQGVDSLVFSGRLCVVTSASMVSRKPQDTSIYAVSSEPNSLKLPPRNGWIKIFPPWCLLTILSFFPFPLVPTVGKCQGFMRTPCLQIAPLRLVVYYGQVTYKSLGRGIPRIAKDPKDWLTSWQYFSGWWLNQPLWKNISQNKNLPQIEVKINNIWNHQLVLIFYLNCIYACWYTL